MTNRRRISTNFGSIKIFLILCCFVVGFSYAPNIFDEAIEILWFILSIIPFLTLLWFIQTRPIVEFDETDKLFVISNHSEQIVPLDKIYKIQFSTFGFNLVKGWSYSYKIFYNDINNKKKTIRLFPRTGANDISKIIKLTKQKNSNVEVCNYSLVLNEFNDKI